MHRNPKDMTQLPHEEQSDFDIEALLAKLSTVLQRDVTNLMMESTRGKLPASSAKDLRDYIELLKKLKIEEEELVKGMSEEELKKRQIAR